MLSDRSRHALIHIRDNIRLAKQFIGAASLDEFRQDVQKFYAVTRCLEIISEASRRLDEATRKRHADVPWNEIMGAGNVYRHGYDGIVEERVWLTVQENLDALLAAVEAELAQ